MAPSHISSDGFDLTELLHANSAQCGHVSSEALALPQALFAILSAIHTSALIDNLDTKSNDVSSLYIAPLKTLPAIVSGIYVSAPTGDSSTELT